MCTLLSTVTDIECLKCIFLPFVMYEERFSAYFPFNLTILHIFTSSKQIKKETILNPSPKSFV